jgi:P27 family predicted phage terminase small subunit
MKRGRKGFGDLSVVPVSAARIEPPDGMTEECARVWHSIVDSLPADYFRPGDVPLLAAFCVAAAFHARAAADIEARGMTLMDDRGKESINPAHQMLTSQASAMAQMAVKLRLCPSARMTGKGAQSKAGDSAKGRRPWGDQQSG